MKFGHRRRVGYPMLSIILVGAFFWLVISAKISLEISGATAIAVFFICVVIYEYLIRPKKIAAGKVGIVLAITGETSDDELRIANDFTKTFRQIVENSKWAASFEVVALPKFLAQDVVDVKSAVKMSEKCKAAFIAFGDVRKRREGGKEFHALRLQCLVRHIPISADTQKQLSTEMTETLPSKIAISCENDLSGFEITSSQFAAGARFIIATAAMLSGDLSFARLLLEDLHGNLPIIKKQGLSLSGEKLPSLITSRLIDCLKVISLNHHLAWRTTRDKNELIQGLQAAEQGKSLGANIPEFHNTKAIAAFVLDRNISQARQHLMNCGKNAPNDPSWRYGLAFLAAYEGDLQSAWRYYQEAFRKDLVDALPNEVEEFIAWILIVEPKKIQLHYCLGILNLKRKGDKMRAIADFGEFLRLCPPEEFADAQKRARKYVA